jgi:hypothetical protein
MQSISRHFCHLTSSAESLDRFTGYQSQSSQLENWVAQLKRRSVRRQNALSHSSGHRD